MGLEASRRVSNLIAVGAIWALTGCAAGMRIGVEEAVAPVDPIAVTEMAIMPVTTETGSEGLRPGLALAIQEVLAERFPSITLVGPEEAGHRLDRASAASDYADLLFDFDRTGVVDTDRLAPVIRAVGADHFLEIRGSYEAEEFLDPLLFSFDEFDDETRQTLVLVARLWTDRGPGPVWEAVVRTISETDDFREEERTVDELIQEVAISLVDRIPVADPRIAGSRSKSF